MRHRQVVETRTRNLSVLLEAVDDPHNQSAVLRSCDAFGILDVHVIRGQRGFQPNRRISQGTHKWLDIHRYRSGEEA